MLMSNEALAVAYKDSDIRRVAALIVGPPDSPYEFGFFEVRDGVSHICRGLVLD